VKHAQDLNLASKIPIRDDKGEPAYEEFPRVFDPASAAQTRVVLKLPYFTPDLGKDPPPRGRIVGGDEVVDLGEVEEGAPRVAQLQVPGPARFSKKASTSSSAANSPRLA